MLCLYHHVSHRIFENRNTTGSIDDDDWTSITWHTEDVLLSPKGEFLKGVNIDDHRKSFKVSFRGQTSAEHNNIVCALDRSWNRGQTTLKQRIRTELPEGSVLQVRMDRW
jgi:hypothetical protein